MPVLFVCLFIPFVYFSIDFCHGEGRCPWREAQQESIWHGWIPEEGRLLKQPVPSYLATRPYHPVAFHTTSILVCSFCLFFFSFFLPSLPFVIPLFVVISPISHPHGPTWAVVSCTFLSTLKLIHNKDDYVAKQDVMTNLYLNETSINDTGKTLGQQKLVSIWNAYNFLCFMVPISWSSQMQSYTLPLWAAFAFGTLEQ